MIEAMRSKAASWVAKILAFFLIIAFAAWGIEDMFRATEPNTEVATIGDIDIPRDELNNQFTRLLRNMQARLGPSFTTEQAVRMGLLDQTLDRLVDSRLLTLEAKRLGLGSGEALVRQTILDNPEFRGPGGGFDPLRFRESLSQQGVSEAGYVEILRGDIMRTQIASALTAGTRVPKTLADTLYRYRNERRQAAVVLLPAGKPDDIATPTNAEITEFHKKNPSLFTAPEYRKVKVLYLDPDVAAREIRPDPKRVREEFEYRKDTMSVPERRTLEQVLLQDEAKANKLIEAVTGGRDFLEAAKEIAGVAPTALGTLRKRDLPEELADAAFAMAKGKLGAPVKSPLGWHVMRATDIQAGKTPKFEDVRADLAKGIAREAAIDRLIKQTNKIDDMLAGGGSLADAGATVGTRPIAVPAIAANGTGPDRRLIKGVPKDPEFLRTMFGLSVGEVSSVIETQNGGFFIVQIDAITPPVLRPLSSVRKEVATAYKWKKLESAAEAQAQKLLARAKATSLAGAAKEAGFEVKQSKPFSRFIRDPTSPVSAELADILFAAKRGDIVTAPGPEGMAVARLEKVIDARPGTNAAETENLNKELTTAIGNDAIAQLIAALRVQYPVTINRAAVDIVAGISDN
ncbi:MAG: peptidyl-prolyl cis-trans isomerase [Alphaproteobacteria bacterium]